MIYVFCGENDFEKKQAIDELGNTKKYDGEILQTSDLRQILFGVNLFDEHKNLIFDLSLNTNLWNDLPNLVEDSPEAEVFLIEHKIDKRSKTYMWLKKNAKVKEFTPKTSRKKLEVMSWLTKTLQQNNLDLDKEIIEDIILRASFLDASGRDFVVDQMLILSAIKILTSVEKVNTEVLDLVLPLTPSQKAFGLMSLIVKGDICEVKKTLIGIENSADPYLTLGLLTSQLSQILALKLSGDRSVSDVASDAGFTAFSLQQLSSAANNVGMVRLKRILDVFLQADENMKNSSLEPWLSLKSAILLATER